MINPPFRRKIDGQAPLNLAYLAAPFKDTNVEAGICDLNISKDPKGELEERIRSFKPTHAAVARYSPNCMESISVLRSIHQLDPSISLISGGPHERFCSGITKARHPWIDHVIALNPAEDELLCIVSGKNDLKSNWRESFPAFHLLDMANPSYSFDKGVFDGRKMLTYMSARGCGMACSFCTSGRYEPIAIETALAHIERIIGMGYRAIFFNDPNFNSLPMRTRSLANAMKERRISDAIRWGCQTIANDSLDARMIAMMAEAGCSYITYSLENADPGALRILNKRISPESVSKKCAIAKTNGLKVGIYAMFGILKDEDKDLLSAMNTLDWIERIGPDFVSYSIYAKYPDYLNQVDYEQSGPAESPAWEFFDEGYGHHPNCSTLHAEALMEEVRRRHECSMRHIKIF